MKNTSLYFTFIAFAIASLLSSCASLQKGEFAQRKYYNFPRSKHEVNQTASVKMMESVITENAIVEKDQNSTEPKLTASVGTKEVMLVKPESGVTSKSKKMAAVNTTLTDEQAETPIIPLKKSDIKKQAKKQVPGNFFGNDSGMMMFVAVIASIFFPPLGIYIKDHHTNKWFWITLVLCLIGAGFFFASITGVWGLCWLIAVVIALMNVFDIL